MKKNRYICLFFLMIVCILLGNGCKKNRKIDKKYYDFQKGFANYRPQEIVETPKGYYFLVENYIYYMDKELSKETILCSKPECLHEKEQMDHVIECEGFFASPTSIGYYDGYLYIAARNISYQERHTSIYKMSLDGTKREVIYTSKDIQAVATHRGNCYIYEKAYNTEGTILIVNMLALDNPQKVTKLYEETYKIADINYMTCYEENCYFMVVDWSTGELVIYNKGINLEDGTVSDYCTFATAPLKVDKNGIYCSKDTTIDAEKYIWENEYYYCGVNGKEKKVLTEKDFPAIARNATLYCVDEKYIYFLDIEYGGREIPKEERRLYIYTYDGTLAATIKTGLLDSTKTIYFSGVENTMIIKDWFDGEFIYYYVDKDTFCGEKVEPKEFLRVNIQSMHPAFSGTYE